MDCAELEAAGINWQAGVSRFMGNRAAYEKIICRFPADPTFSAMKEAFLAGDIPEAFRQAHSLKGNAGNLSFDLLYQDIVPFVEALRANDYEAALSHFPAVEKDYLLLAAVLGRDIP